MSPRVHDALSEMPLASLAGLLRSRKPYVGFDPFGRFVCPLCNIQDHNGGTAIVVDDQTWHCARCGAQTRYVMVDCIVKSPILLKRALLLLEPSR
jgi:hypothetical protein